MRWLRPPRVTAQAPVRLVVFWKYPAVLVCSAVWRGAVV
jgi:hypothetical protein